MTPRKMNGVRVTSATELASLADENGSAHTNGNGRVPPSPENSVHGDGEDEEEDRELKKRTSLTKRAERYKRIASRKVTHRKSAPLAASDGEHTVLFNITNCWRVAIREPTDLSTDDDSTDMYGGKAETELKVEQMLEAFVSTNALVETFGPLMQLAIKNDMANFDKVRAAWNDLGRGDSAKVARLRGLLEAERASGIHKGGGVLADPSAAIALVWIRRSLDFQNTILETISTDRAVSVVNVAKDAYKAHLETYHNFWLKNTFRAALSGLPSRTEFLQRLAPNLAHSLQTDERERICYSEMAELVEVQQKAVATMSALLVELDLQDSRKA